MPRLYIKPTLEKAIRDYCELNEIDDINAFANRCATQGFNIVKFGMSPLDNINRETNGIKDIKKNDKGQIKQESIGKDGREQKKVKNKQEIQHEKNKEEEIEREQEKKENVTVRKIRIIKKQ